MFLSQPHSGKKSPSGSTSRWYLKEWVREGRKDCKIYKCMYLSLLEGRGEAWSAPLIFMVFFLPRDSLLYKCKAIIIMITFRLNVILKSLQEIKNFADSHWNGSRLGFPILTSSFWSGGTAWGRGWGREGRLTPCCFIYLYDLYQMHPLPLGHLVYLKPAVSMYSKWKESSPQQTSTTDQ